MTRRLANWLTFLLWVTLVTTALFAIVTGQERVPLATEAQRAFAPLAVSEDGRTVTFRSTAKDSLLVCVEPLGDKFGKRVCFTVGDVRTGRWGLK